MLVLMLDGMHVSLGVNWYSYCGATVLLGRKCGILRNRTTSLGNWDASNHGMAVSYVLVRNRGLSVTRYRFGQVIIRPSLGC